jgi:uncharacterized protein YfaS (alpha-2-macroglobulin family)
MQSSPRLSRPYNTRPEQWRRRQLPTGGKPGARGQRSGCATLTRGDEVSFPVAVYNYLDTAQTVRVEMQPADWFTPLGGTGIDIDLGPGQVTGVRFPVRVDKVGRQTMTVKGTGATVADAVARSVLVVPDGQAVPVAASGTLGAGTITNTVNFPAAAQAAQAGSPAQGRVEGRLP